MLDNARRTARLAFDAFFDDVDVLIAPVASSAAFPKDEEGLRAQTTARIEEGLESKDRETFRIAAETWMKIRNQEDFLRGHAHLQSV